MDNRVTSDNILPECIGYFCECFFNLPTDKSLYNLKLPQDYFRYTAKLVEAHLNLVYKHQLADQILSSSTFATVQALFIKQVFESQLETLKIFESLLKDSKA